MLHILGMGTRWGRGFTPYDIVDQNCNYGGAEANSVYRSLTGCSAVPLEKVTNQNGELACFHWYGHRRMKILVVVDNFLTKYGGCSRPQERILFRERGNVACKIVGIVLSRNYYQSKMKLTLASLFFLGYESWC